MLSKQDKFLRTCQTEICTLAQLFASYPPGITKFSIESYLCQFEPQDMQVGLKMLQNVSFYDESSMINLTRKLKQAVYSLNNNSFDNVIFCPMSYGSGDSASVMKRRLRHISDNNNPSMKLYEQQHFLNTVIDLQRSALKDDANHKKIIFIDHFIGSGDSILYPWGMAQQWQNVNHEYYVGVLIGYSDAIKIVEDTTFSRLKVLPMIELSGNNRAFHDNNNAFTKSEKMTLMKYCDGLGLDEDEKYGYNNGQSLVVFSDIIPDNALPILHHTTSRWKPLFPRQK